MPIRSVEVSDSIWMLLAKVGDASHKTRAKLIRDSVYTFLKLLSEGEDVKTAREQTPPGFRQRPRHESLPHLNYSAPIR